jgi:hypothetical protein
VSVVPVVLRIPKGICKAINVLILTDWLLEKWHAQRVYSYVHPTRCEQGWETTVGEWCFLRRDVYVHVSTRNTSLYT